MLDSMWKLVAFDVGIDLGTANTLVYVRGRGIVMREPTVVAKHTKTRQVVAVGSPAKAMIGKAPAVIKTIRPVANGVVADFDAAQSLIASMLDQLHDTPGKWRRLPRPRVVVGVPSLVTEVERRAVIEAAIKSGARSVYLVDESMASALGCGLLDGQAAGKLLVDIGGGTTEIAVVSLDGLVVNRSVPVAGWEMDQAIINYIRSHYQLIIGDQMAERLKIEIGEAIPDANAKGQGIARGRDAVTGLPKAINVRSQEIRQALDPILNQLTALIQQVLEETPPELSADITESGLTVAGGGALLPGLDQYFATQLQMPVAIANDPLTAVVQGTAILLDDTSLLKRLAISTKRGKRG
jgi:rod shape-determining protein MreB